MPAVLAAVAAYPHAPRRAGRQCRNRAHGARKRSAQRTACTASAGRQRHRDDHQQQDRPGRARPHALPRRADHATLGRVAQRRWHQQRRSPLFRQVLKDGATVASAPGHPLDHRQARNGRPRRARQAPGCGAPARALPGDGVTLDLNTAAEALPQTVPSNRSASDRSAHPAAPEMADPE